MTEYRHPPIKAYSPDDFQTPPEAVYPLLPYLKNNWTVWECAQGKGYLTRHLERQGYRVTGSDILTGQDFLTWEPPEWDCLITNPPYSLKQRFLVRAYALGKPFALLLPLTTLETRARQELFRTKGIEIILFDKRVDFETPNKAESKSWFATAWFTWGLGIGKELTFVQLRPQGILL